MPTPIQIAVRRIAVLCFALATASTAVLAQSVPYAIQQVIKRLADENPKTRSAAAIRAGQLRDPLLLDALARALDDKDSLVRSHAAAAIRGTSDERATTILAGALEHHDPAVRVHAGYRFAEKPNVAMVARLGARLQDPHSEVRLQAATAIRVAGSPAGDDLLIAALTHTDPAVRNQAVTRFISAPNPKAFDKLNAALNDTDNSVRQNAAQALCVSPEERADDVMIAALRHPDPNVRMQAALRFTQRPNKKAIDALIAAVGDYHSTVQSYARQALGKIDDGRAKSAAKRGKPSDATNLVQWHRSHVSQVPGRFRGQVNEMKLLDSNRRRRAAQAVIKKKDDNSTKAALALMDHPDPTVRTYFVNWFYSRPEPLAVAKLQTALNDIDTNIRRVAARALIRSAEDGSRAVALAMLDHHDAGVKYEAANYLTGKPDPQSLPKLVATLNDMNDQVRQLAARALAKIPGDEARQQSLAALAHSDPVVRFEATNRFRSMPDPVAIRPLKTLLNDPQTTVRQNAIAALRAIPGEEAGTAIIDFLLHDDPDVRRQAIDRFYDHPDPRAATKMITALDDWNLDVQRSAARALSRSGNVAAVDPLYSLTKHTDTQLRRYAVAALKAIHALAISDRTPETQLPLGFDHAVQWLKSSQPSLTQSPRAYVEFYGGDRLIGEVLFANPGGYIAGKTIETNLDVKLRNTYMRSLGSRSRTPPRDAATIGDVRINTRWLRKVVWQSRDEPLKPRTVFLRDGRSLRYLSIRWHHQAVKLLTDAGVRDIPLAEIAEVHLPPRTPWPCYYEQLTYLGFESNSQILRLGDLGGATLSCSTSRFRPFHEVASADASGWYHALQPAWSLDTLLVNDHAAWIRSARPPEQVPLMLLPKVSSAKGATSRNDRNVKGGLLCCGPQTYRWGYGVHADMALAFELPSFATAIETRIGLDRLAGSGGCARGIVRVNSVGQTQQLYKSELLIGSDQVYETGTLNLPAPRENWTLELIADAAHRDRPEGTDPLNIRDTLDWLEPIVALDQKKLKFAVSRKVPGHVPAWTGWTVLPGQSQFSVKNEWRRAGFDANSFCRAIASHNGPLTLKRRITVPSRATRLIASVCRLDESADACRLELRLDGRSMGVFDVPNVTESTDAAPIIFPLTEYRAQSVDAELVHQDQTDNVQLHWRAIHIESEPAPK